jgi:serine protease inhibitor
LYAEKVKVKLPRFKINYKKYLAKDLLDLGNGIIFSDYGDLPLINP